MTHDDVRPLLLMQEHGPGVGLSTKRVGEGERKGRMGGIEREIQREI